MSRSYIIKSVFQSDQLVCCYPMYSLIAERIAFRERNDREIDVLIGRYNINYCPYCGDKNPVQLASSAP